MFKFYYRIAPAKNDTVTITMTGPSKLKLTALSLMPSVLMFAGFGILGEAARRQNEKNKKTTSPWM